jgi:hypothetical protein
MQQPKTRKEHRKMTEVAISTFSIIVAMVLNLIPGGVTSFTIKDDVKGRETITLTKQADGGWKMSDGPKRDMGTIYLDGTKLTAKSDGKKQTVDLADHVDIDKDTDWKKLKTISLKGATLKIERKPNGLDLILRDGKKDDGGGERLKVRWEVPKKE